MLIGSNFKSSRKGHCCSTIIFDHYWSDEATSPAALEPARQCQLKKPCLVWFLLDYRYDNCTCTAHYEAHIQGKLDAVFYPLPEKQSQAQIDRNKNSNATERSKNFLCSANLDAVNHFLSQQTTINVRKHDLKSVKVASTCTYMCYRAIFRINF